MVVTRRGTFDGVSTPCCGLHAWARRFPCFCMSRCFASSLFLFASILLSRPRRTLCPCRLSLPFTAFSSIPLPRLLSCRRLGP